VERYPDNILVVGAWSDRVKQGEPRRMLAWGEGIVVCGAFGGSSSAREAGGEWMTAQDGS